jgi:hypothetical protein
MQFLCLTSKFIQLIYLICVVFSVIVADHCICLRSYSPYFVRLPDLLALNRLPNPAFAGPGPSTSSSDVIEV